MDTIYYVVESLNGDYAELRRLDLPEEDLKTVARALLPDSINEGSQLKYELFTYELV